MDTRHLLDLDLLWATGSRAEADVALIISEEMTRFGQPDLVLYGDAARHRLGQGDLQRQSSWQCPPLPEAEARWPGDRQRLAQP